MRIVESVITLYTEFDASDIDGLSDMDHAAGRVIDEIIRVCSRMGIVIKRSTYTRADDNHITYDPNDDVDGDDDPEDEGPFEFE